MAECLLSVNFVSSPWFLTTSVERGTIVAARVVPVNTGEAY